MKGLKQYAVGAAQRTARRILIRTGVAVVVGGGALAYRYVTGQPVDEPTQPAHAATHASSASAADTAHGVQLQGSVKAPAPAATAAAPATPPAATPQVRVPDINAPKRAAQRAADAASANIAEQTGQALPNRAAPAPVAAPAAPRSGPGSVPATAVARPETPAGAVANVPPVTREVFTYSADGRRDPFYSLILTEDLRPLLSDLKLVGVLYEPSGRRSVAVMRDILTNKQYRVSPGQTLGRMRVTQIRQKGVIFTIDEFGLSRQDSLVLTDTTKVRN